MKKENEMPEQHIGSEWNKAPEVLGIDLTASNAAELLAEQIEEQLDNSEFNTAEKAALIKLMKDAYGKCEPKYRAAFVSLLMNEFPKESLSGKEFTAYGFKVCIQQVPTYNYQNDVKEAKMAAELEQMKMKYKAKEKALKGYRDGLVAERGLKPEHIDYRLRVINK